MNMARSNIFFVDYVCEPCYYPGVVIRQKKTQIVQFRLTRLKFCSQAENLSNSGSTQYTKFVAFIKHFSYAVV